MLNKVQLIGNLGRDPEVRSAGSGRVADLAVATTENWKDRDGVWQQKTEWHRVFGWGFIADAAEKLSKGDQVYIEGSIETQKWQDNDGNDKFTTKVKARVLRKLGRKERSDDGSGGYDGSGSSGQGYGGTGEDVPF